MPGHLCQQSAVSLKAYGSSAAFLFEHTEMAVVGPSSTPHGTVASMLAIAGVAGAVGGVLVVGVPMMISRRSFAVSASSLLG